MEICTCGLLKQKKVGTFVDASEIERCNNCHQPIHFAPARDGDAGPIKPRMMSTLENLPGYRVIATHGVVTELAAARASPRPARDRQRWIRLW